MDGPGPVTGVHDRPGELRPEDHRQLERPPGRPGAGVKVGVVDSARLHLDQDVARTASGIGEGCILHRLCGPIFVERSRFQLPVTSESEFGLSARGPAPASILGMALVILAMLHLNY